MVNLIEHQSTDVDDQAKALAGWHQHYEQLGCGGFSGSVWQLVMADGLLIRESTNRKLREQICPPTNHLVLAIPLSVMEGSVFAGRPLNRDSLMVLSGNNEYDVVSAGDLDLIGLSIHSDTLGQALAPEKMAWVERAQKRGHLDLPPEIAGAIRQMLMAVCADAEAQIDRLSTEGHGAELLASTVSQTVLLAMASEGDMGASAIPRRADTRMRVVKRAVEFIRANLHNDIGVPEICSAACASRRTLQYCFEEFMLTTPQAYLRALRLNEARRALKRQTDVPITSVAHELGFGSASNFTRHYKMMFDELPSETLKFNC